MVASALLRGPFLIEQLRKPAEDSFLSSWGLWSEAGLITLKKVKVDLFLFKSPSSLLDGSFDWHAELLHCVVSGLEDIFRLTVLFLPWNCRDLARKDILRVQLRSLLFLRWIFRPCSTSQHIIKYWLPVSTSQNKESSKFEGIESGRLR